MKNPFDMLPSVEGKTFNRVRIVSTIWYCTMTIYTVLAVELTIAWTAIDGVYTIQTTGQLIPFIIGLMGLFKALHDVNFESKVSIRLDKPWT